MPRRSAQAAWTPASARGPRAGVVEPDLEHVCTCRNVVGWVGMAFGRTEHRHRWLGEVAGALGRRDNDRTGTVGLEAAVVEPHWLTHPARGQIVLHRERLLPHHRF